VHTRHQRETSSPHPARPPLVGAVTGQVEAVSQLGPPPGAGERAAAAAWGDTFGVRTDKNILQSGGIKCYPRPMLQVKNFFVESTQNMHIHG
jgi:hypothetical protein